ncbi:hypothetical protein MWU60_04635 [Yoonia sp. F2084L]|uniref:hypothetical protein n=1 Tax=Yoonia sp. F2084L TaxID=2926419 RepID=UPI001FF38509|nr:hypothetical protein [Yoonia sp. F2084L]MCK0094844.1 hypothetical protein [Yoonia sp. F2084L]
MEQQLSEQGYAVFPDEPEVADWAATAATTGCAVLEQGGERRHGSTWFVGVDALPNAPDGSINGVPLTGRWLRYVDAPAIWHAAQLSVVFPGYPQRDAHEGEAAHLFRRNRDAAHVDGLLPEGQERRRHLREPHAFILGLPLDDVAASPLVVWPGSHLMMRAAFRAAFKDLPPKAWGDLDVTKVYQTTRRAVFDTCQRVEISAKPGQAVLLDRHLLHGVAPWAADAEGAMRMIAYFRPQTDVAAWL